MGSESVKVMAYNSVHRGKRSDQMTPGAKSISILKQLREISKGSGKAAERMKLVFTASLTEHLLVREAVAGSPTRRRDHPKRIKTVATPVDSDAACRVPIDRSRPERVDFTLVRDVVPHDACLKNKADHLEPLLTYTRVSSTWMSIWAFYAYYLSCSEKVSAPHLSAWVTARPLMELILDIFESDPMILLTFFKQGNDLPDICDRILPQKNTAYDPLFAADTTFGPAFEPADLHHMREAAFVESMEIRERWVSLLLSNLKLLGLGSSHHSSILDIFTGFAAKHPQIIPYVYPCKMLPSYFTAHIFQSYICYCVQLGGKVIGAEKFIENHIEDDNVIDDAMELLGHALRGIPDKAIILSGMERTYTNSLYVFYGHAQLWVELALDMKDANYDKLLSDLEEGREVRLQTLRTYKNEWSEDVEKLCEQEEQRLIKMVTSKKIREKYPM